ncbi:LOW QUALITY PROTEIN: tRNA pseudouridine synthase Pus10-like [Gigantopelta aegis]|uniref:LOW QUALITY PROTEIN: tRNA pseudouridine synthase Pus10-like n=1 Tax=Gigantopelta aegis TaxID=1735272 RepID=UPI001B889600|nr:LOW QUALITY PROTEIN: tRNA pseudouridine synthase Pus10-like [Gigantopelta aegis]
MEELELITSSEDDARSVAKCLVDVGCCPRCVLRFMGEKRPHIYKKTIEQASDVVRQLCQTENNTSFSGVSKPCPACLGILQDFSCKEFFIKIKEQVDEEGYQFTDYLCSLMVPICTQPRQHAVFIHLKTEFSEIYKSVKEDNISSIKDIWKWFAGPELALLLGIDFQQKSDFEICITFIYDNSDKECGFLLNAQPEVFRKRKCKRYGFETFTRASVAKALMEIDEDKFKRFFHCPPAIPDSICRYEITCCHEAVYIAGRYQKFSRILSQTPWIVDGGRKSESSVQELICESILDRFKPTDHKFSASGREDVDVRMLGTGRPFIVELVNPHVVMFSPEELKTIQEKINMSTSDVAVQDLQIISREETSNLKEGEIDKTKSYCALCCSEKPLSQEDLNKLHDIKNLTLQQKTPIRVLHRRPLAVRERVIHEMRTEKVDDHRFKLYLSTQAGTYIKEFVHGDFGRTNPHLSTLLGTDCDIVQLDVESVNVEWPPRLAR